MSIGSATRKGLSYLAKPSNRAGFPDEFITILKETYHTRDASRIEDVAAWMDDRCVTIGTSFGELTQGKADFIELVKSDLKYWVDIDISPEFQLETAGVYQAVTLSADAICKFTVNEKTYERYIGYMKDIRREAVSEYAKAVKVIWELDHLIASKPGVRHIDRKPLMLHLLAQDGVIKLISYAHVQQKNHVDCFAGIQEDMDSGYDEDCAALTPDADLSQRLMRDVRLDGLRFDHVVAQRCGDWFVGCGKLRNDASIDEELKRDFCVLDEQRSPYQTLYTLRKRLGETLRLYSYGDTQSIMTRFFGVLEDQQIAMIKHTYPFYWILED